METNKIRPKFSSKEWLGCTLVISFFFTAYLICFAILSGDLDGAFFYSLDLTGGWVAGGERWSNASITYRDLMIPVYVVANLLMWAVFIVTLLTRDWKNISEWEKNVNVYKLITLLLPIFFVYWVATSLLGKAEIIYEVSELSRFIERPALLDRYYFFIVLFFFVTAGYYGAEYVAISLVKAKKIKPIFMLNKWLKKNYSIKKCSECNGKMKCIEKKHYKIIDMFGFLILAVITFFVMLTIFTIIGILGEWYSIFLMIISMYFTINYLLWKIVGYDLITYCKCQHCAMESSKKN